jgi:hypothetical protein
MFPIPSRNFALRCKKCLEPMLRVAPAPAVFLLSSRERITANGKVFDSAPVMRRRLSSREMECLFRITHRT